MKIISSHQVFRITFIVSLLLYFAWPGAGTMGQALYAQDAQEQVKSEKVESEKLEKEKIERERLEKEKAEKEKFEKEKAEREQLEREQAEKEKIEREKLEKEKIEKEKARKKFSIIDKDRKEYVAFFAGYGCFFPVADYGTQYKASHLFSAAVGIYYLNFLGFSPELHFRYTDMGTKKDPLRYNSSITQFQFFPAIIYRYPIALPRNTLTVYARIWDGLSHVSYSSRNPYYPMIKENIVENINTFGISAGVYYDVWKGLLVGVDLGYGITFTAGKMLQGVSVMVNVGWRVL
jgi:hypothetical protein